MSDPAKNRGETPLPGILGLQLPQVKARPRIALPRGAAQSRRSRGIRDHANGCTALEIRRDALACRADCLRGQAL